MNNNNQDIEKIISETSFRTLSIEEQSRVWESVVRANKKTLPFKQNKQFMLKPIIAALIIAVGLGGTVALADNSAPGDTLFAIDRAVENLRINLASEQKKDTLRVAFADERVKEVEHISSPKTGTTSVDISKEDKTRVTVGINAAIALLNSVSSSADANTNIKLKTITDELNKYLATLPADSTVGVTVKKDDDGESRIDLRTVDGKIRVEVKEGEIKIKTSDNSDKSEYSNKNDDDSDDRYDSSSKGRGGDDDDEGEDSDDDDDKPRTPPVVVTPPSGSTATAYTLADVKLHNTSASCWTAVNGSVYNVTSWISAHPGGSSAIKGMCGVDASGAFNGQHGGQARPVSELASFKIGVLK